MELFGFDIRLHVVAFLIKGSKTDFILLIENELKIILIEFNYYDLKDEKPRTKFVFHLAESITKKQNISVLAELEAALRRLEEF